MKKLGSFRLAAMRGAASVSSRASRAIRRRRQPCLEAVFQFAPKNYVGGQKIVTQYALDGVEVVERVVIQPQRYIAERRGVTGRVRPEKSVPDHKVERKILVVI